MNLGSHLSSRAREVAWTLKGRGRRYGIVTTDSLNGCDGATVDYATLQAKGIVSKSNHPPHFAPFQNHSTYERRETQRIELSWYQKQCFKALVSEYFSHFEEHTYSFRHLVASKDCLMHFLRPLATGRGGPRSKYDLTKVLLGDEEFTAQGMTVPAK